MMCNWPVGDMCDPFRKTCLRRLFICALPTGRSASGTPSRIILARLLCILRELNLRTRNTSTCSRPLDQARNDTTVVQMLFMN